MGLALPEGTGLELTPSPRRLLHPVKKTKTVDGWPHIKQIFLDGKRIGYVNVKPGAPIMLIQQWHPEQLKALATSIVELLAKSGFDVSQDRKVNQPKAKGLINLKAENAEVMTEAIDPE